MAAFKKGQIIKIPCEIQPGAFLGENLITIKTDKGEISGFIKSNHVIQLSGRSYVHGHVTEVTSDHITVRFPGSFFTTASGLTTASQAWATSVIPQAPSA